MSLPLPPSTSPDPTVRVGSLEDSGPQAAGLPASGTLIEIIIIIIAGPEKRVLNDLHCSRVDIGRGGKIIAPLGGMMLGSAAGKGTLVPVAWPVCKT